MATKFSYAFREAVKSLNASSILDSLLNTFNSSLVDISEDDNRLLVSFREWPESLLSHIFTINVDYNELSKKSLKINNLDSLVTDIIRTCDKEASKYFKSDSNLDLDFKLVIEKYALKDFITELTKNYFKENVYNQKVFTISVNPLDAKLFINDIEVSTINGTFSDKAIENSKIKVRIEKENYKTIEDTIEINTNIFKFELEPVYKTFHLAVVPDSENVHLYEKISKISLKEKASSLKESLTPSSFVDDNDLEFAYNEIPLDKREDMFFAKVKQGSNLVLKVKKRYYKDVEENITFDNSVFKVIELENYFVPVSIKFDDENNNRLFINDELVQTPYNTKLAVGEALKIEAIAETGESYKNFVIANEADIKNGLEFNIKFTKMYNFDIQVEDDAKLYINNLLIDGNRYSEKLIEGSVVDVRVHKEDYVDVNERFYITHDIEKSFVLSEKLPKYNVSISVQPQNAYLLINGKQVSNPFEDMIAENSEIQIKSFLNGYKAITENVIVNTDISKDYVLEEAPIVKPLLNISCNIPDATLSVNGEDITIPAAIYGEPGKLYSVVCSKEGFKTFTKDIRLLENTNLDIKLVELSEAELEDTVKLRVNCSKLNSIIMINGKQIDNLSEMTYPRNTIVDIEATYPGYVTYSNRFTLTEDTDLDIVLEKSDNLSTYRVYIYNSTTGAVLEVNDKVVSSPFVSDFEFGSKVKIKAHLDGYQTFERELTIDQDYIVNINLQKNIDINIETVIPE